jgi:HEPN domain-containing protein
MLQASRNDLAAARRALPGDPATAAAHAQQCSEKAVKAAAFEMGDFRNEREFRDIAKTIGHDSTRACLRVIRDLVAEVWKKSGFDEQRANYKRLMTTKHDAAATVAFQLGERAHTMHQKTMALLDLPPVKPNDKIWHDSLDPNLNPDAEVDGKWSNELAEVHEIGNEVWISIANLLHLDSPRAYKLYDPSTHLQEKLDIIEEIVEERQRKGMTSAATGLKSAGSELERIFVSDLGLEAWIRLVVGWGPYLDVHEERGRYYDRAHLDEYKKHPKGVENLINKAEEILNQTEILVDKLGRRSEP